MKQRRIVRNRGELLPSVNTFEVGDGATLIVANFPGLTPRRDYYYISDRFAAPADLADAMDQCQPLEWELSPSALGASRIGSRPPPESRTGDTPRYIRAIR